MDVVGRTIFGAWDNYRGHGFAVEVGMRATVGKFSVVPGSECASGRPLSRVGTEQKRRASPATTGALAAGQGALCPPESAVLSKCAL